MVNQLLETIIFQLNKATYAAGISAFASISDIGGIHHYNINQTSFIQNCYNSGQIVGRTAAGIFNLSVSDIHLENCYNTGTIVGNEFDHSSDGCAIAPIVSKASAIVPYGKEFIRNCYSNGNSVVGTMWKTSTTLGRKVRISRSSHKKVVELSYDDDSDLEALLLSLCGEKIFKETEEN